MVERVDMVPGTQTNEGNPGPVLEQINRIAEATSIETVWELLVSGLAAYGFVRVNYGLTRGRVGSSIGDPQDVLFLSTRSLDRVRDHHVSGLYRGTPEYRWVLEKVGCVSWGWVQEQRALGKLSADECRAMGAVQAERRRAGVSISFAESSQRTKGAMGLAAERGVLQSDLDQRFPAISAPVMALCNMGHFKMSQMPLPVLRSKLAERQRELLEWVADGKTMQDIGVLTGLSVSAIEKHLRRAREALEVETTAQAVAKAAFLNQMFVSRGI
jgi:DNA-binding CsgD family transcriptional regulator